MSDGSHGSEFVATADPGATIASLGQRAAARGIDTMAYSMLSALIILVWILTTPEGRAEFTATSGQIDVEALFELVPIGVFAIVGVLPVIAEAIMLRAFGATLGKLLLRLRVRSADAGLPIGWQAAVTRALVPAAPGLILLPFVGAGGNTGGMIEIFIYLSAIRDPVLRRGLPDLAAGTVVLRPQRRVVELADWSAVPPPGPLEPWEPVEEWGPTEE